MTFPNKSDVLKNKDLCFRCCKVKNKDLCFRCCKGKHRANNCKSEVYCDVCESDRHVTCMHFLGDSSQDNCGENSSKEAVLVKGGENVATACTQLCGKDNVGRSCGKIVLLNVCPAYRPEQTLRMYALIDDHSNKTLPRSEFFDHFGLTGNDHVFTLKSCSGSVTFSG